jgi:hypothetical protein
MTMTARQEAEYALAYGTRDDCTSDEARAEYDRLKASLKPHFGPPPKKEPPRKEPGPVAGKALAVLSSLGLAVLVLIAGIVLQSVSGAKAGLCNTVIGQFAQQQSTGTTVDCGLWTALDTFGQVLTWLGGIGTVLLALVFGLTWLGKLK